MCLALGGAGCGDDSDPVVIGGDGGTKVPDGGDTTPTDGGGGGPIGTDLLDCESRDVTGATVVDGDIDTDTTWSGTVHVTSAVDVVDGAKLTIEAGTHVVMAVDTDLEVGWNGNAASIYADGTAAAPIRFCGETADAGWWGAVYVQRNVTSDSFMRNVLISDAGGADAGLFLNTDITVANVQVRNSDTDGVHAFDFKDDSERLVVEGAAGAAAVLTGPGAVTNFPLGGSLTGNGEDVVRIRFGDIDVDTTYHDPGVPYLQEGSIDVVDGAVVTFEAGIEHRFAPDTDFEVGWNGNDATLQIEGTETDPVVFRGDAEESGFWSGLLVRQNVRTNSSIAWLELRHAGGGEAPAIRLESPITVTDTTLDTNDTGMWVSATGFDPDSANLTITGTAGVPMTVQPNALITLPEGGDYSGNDDDYVDVEGGNYTANGTVPNLGVPYRVRASIDTRDSSVLTLTAGSEFVMTADTTLEIGWNGNESTINAVGTADSPIRFIGSDPTPGRWGGIQVRSAVSTDSTLEYVEIGHGGGEGAGYNLLLQAAITVTNSTFFDSSGYGIVKSGDAASVDYSSGNTFMNNASGDVGTP